MSHEELTMTEPVYDDERSPKGDHNRRIALGFSLEEFAAEAGLIPETLRQYETTGPDDDFNLAVAHQVGLALDRLEALADQPDTDKPTFI
jgi:transcriptional regulator with XRE-family HTH domain